MCMCLGMAMGMAMGIGMGMGMGIGKGIDMGMGMGEEMARRGGYPSLRSYLHTIVAAGRQSSSDNPQEDPEIFKRRSLLSRVSNA